MKGIEPFESASNLLEDMGMFEAATHAPPTALPPVRVATVLLALDRSNQDAPARVVAGATAAALGATVSERDDLTTEVAVVEAVRQLPAQLLVLPVPFGADIGELREASLGDVVDRILVDARVPILAVHQPLDDGKLTAVLRRIVVPMTPGEPRTADALAWACRLLANGGSLTVIEVADRDVLAEANRLRGETGSPESSAGAAIERVMMGKFAGLVAAVQKAGSQTGFDVHVDAVGGRFVAQALAAVGDQPGLVIVAGSADRRSATFHHAADLILGSTFPVLIV